MWIAADDAEILPVEFANVSPLTFGYGFLGNAKSLHKLRAQLSQDIRFSIFERRFHRIRGVSVFS